MVRPLLLSAALLASSPAFAGENCVVTAGPHDRVARGKSVVVEPGESVENAVSIDGDVILRKGARAKSAVAVNGNLILEDGAKVTGTAATVGGQIRLDPGAKISGSRVQLSDGIQIQGENGNDLGLALSISGHDISKLVVSKLAEKARSCRIVSTNGDGEVRL